MSASSWKEQPFDLLTEAWAAASGRRRRRLAGGSVNGLPKTDSVTSSIGPFYGRDPKDYGNYPKSGAFRNGGLALGYYWRWQQFLTGRIDEVPPSFNVYSRDLQAAMKDCDMAEIERKRIENIRRSIRGSRFGGRRGSW